MTLIPKFELLEDRIVLDGADPIVTITGPSEPLDLGQQDVGFTLTFDNDGTESGFVPYAELIIPTSGGDGEGDGPTFDSATFLGGPIETTELTFNADGEVEHPFLVDTMTGDPLIVTGGMEGDTLVIFELPYGSFSPGNVPVDIDVVIDFSDQADLGSMPQFQALGGFALGCDAEDNPGDDAPIRGAVDTEMVDPQLFEVTKVNNAPEAEAATGPSYIYTYSLIVDVAPGQTLDDFTLTDSLPPEIVYVGNVTINGGVGGEVRAPEPTIDAQVQPGDEFIVDFDEVSGTVTVTFDYWISNDPSDRATPTNDPTSGAPTPVTNTVVGEGTWNPLDPDDSQGVPVTDDDTDILEASTLAIQKSNVVLDDQNASGASPGDIYTFTLNVQVSDYFTFGDLVIDDILGDGWDYLEGTAEFYTVENTGAIGAEGAEESLTGVETVTAVMEVDPDDMMLKLTGETLVSWDISQAMEDEGSDGLLTGDLAGPAVSNGSQTRVVITYNAQILEDFEDSGIGEQSISQGDTLLNNVTITGDVRDNFVDGGDPAIATNNALTETSMSDVTIATGQIESKSVFALNGETDPPSDLVIAAGDTVTFQIIYTAPLAAFEEFRIEDNLPQLVFDPEAEFDEMTAWEAAPADRDAAPAAGQAYFGSSTSTGILAEVPTITTDGPNNGITFDLGEFTAPTPEEATIEILFTATVQDAVFADDLLLTNQATAFETNTFGEEISSTAIAMFDYGEPNLNISKGVVATDSTDPETEFVSPDPAVADGVTGLTDVTIPSTDVPRFSGTVTSDSLDLAPVNSNIESVDAGDTVTFAIVLENTGSAPNGAFNVTVVDTLPPEFIIPGSGLNLSITDGAGTSIGFTLPDGTPAVAADIFEPGGIMLNDDAALQGALSAFDETSGENVIVITYDLEVIDDVLPSTTSTNTAGIATYNAFEGNGRPLDMVDGPVNRVTDPIVDDASATTEAIEIDKRIDPASREFNDDISGRDDDEVAIGEVFEFIVRVDVPEGEMSNFNISDSVTNGGLTLIEAEIVTFGSEMASSTGLGVGGVADTITVVGNAWNFDFGTLENDGDNDPDNDFIEIRVLARASDGDVGNANHFMRNVAEVSFQGADGMPVTDSDPEDIRLIEPRVALDKTASPAVIDAGGTVNYEVEITNPSGFRDAPAFDLTLSDVLHPNLTLDAGAGDIVLFVNGVNTPFDGTNFILTTPAGGDANAFEVFIDVLNQDDTVVVQYSGVADPDIAAGLTMPNTANLAYDSTPEDDSGADNDDRDYSLSDTEEVVTRAPSIDKSVVDPDSTTYFETSGSDLGVGELITYELVVSIPEGVTDTVVLTDTLPAGMEYVTSEVVRIGDVTTPGAAGPADNIDGSGLNVGAEGSNVLQVTTFTFGNLTNVNDLTSDSKDEIVVRVTARTTDAGGVVAGDALVNTGALSFSNGDGNTQTVEDTETVTLVEPEVTLDKSVLPLTADAGDTVTYTLRADNIGNGPAYDMVITDDVVGAEIDATGAVTITIFDGAGGVYTPVEAPTFSFNGLNELEVIVPDLPADHEVVVTYDAVVQDSAVFSTAYTNTAEVARYDSNPLGDAVTGPADPDEEERVYTGPTDTAVVTTPDATLDKSYLSSLDTNTGDGPPAQLNIGEQVTYQLTITVPQGTADIVLTDDLPAGLLAQSARVVSIGEAGDTATGLVELDTDADPNLTINGDRDQVTFDFGTVTIAGSDDLAATDTTIVVEVTSIVEDLAGLEDGDTLTNTATLTLTDPAGGGPLQPPVEATETVEIVEPDLDLVKSGPVGADPEDIVPYSITVTNNGTGPAYDATITDPFTDANLTYVVGSADVFLNGTLLDPQPALAEPAPMEADGFAFSGLTLLVGDVIRVDFNVELAAGALDADTFINTATVNYDSVEGTLLDADMNPLGRDDTATDDHSIATVPRIEKSPVASQFSETDSIDGSTPFALAIGEEVTYRYVITLPEIALDSVVATDLLPPGTEFVSASVTNVNGTGSDGTVGITQDLGNPNLVTFDFGAMTNPSDGAIGTDDELVFEVVARITNDGNANAGDTLTNTVSLDVTPNGGLAFDRQVTDAEVFIVEPELSIEKTGPLALDPGGAAGTFTVTVTNDGVEDAEGPAYDLDISDALPMGMTLDTGSFSFATGGGVTLTPETFTADTDSFLAEFALLLPGDSIVITYQASLDAGQAALTTFENTASADFFSAPEDLVDEGGDPVAEDYTPVTDTHEIWTQPTIDKDAIASGQTETPENADADDFQDLAIGETVTYALTLTLPEIPMDSVVLTDALPVGLSFVSAEVTGLGSEITVDGETDLVTINADADVVQMGQDLSITLANVVNTANGTIVEGEDAITVQIVARVDDDTDLTGALPNSQLTNTAGLTITPQGQGAFAEVETTETVEIVEPNLIVEKTGDPAMNPGDEVDYSVSITNNGTGPAFDITVADDFADPNLSLVMGSVMIELDTVDITLDVVVTETATGFTFDLVDDATGDPFPMPVGSNLVVTYTALLDANAPEAQSFPNTATVGYDGLPGDPLDENGDPVDGRDYTAQDDNTVATVPFITKTPTGSSFTTTDSIEGSDPFDLSIGEEVTYTYELYLPEIDLASAVMEDSLTAGLEFVSFNLVSYGSDMTALDGSALGAPTVTELSDQDFIVDFGGIRNNSDGTIGPDDIITVELVARVTNDGVPSAGDVLPNTVSLEVIPVGAGPLATATAEADIRVVEPELEIDKTGPALIPPGGTGPYEITVRNTGPDDAPDAAGPAHDVFIEDVLPDGLSIVSPITITLDGMPYTPGPGELVLTATGFTLDIPVLQPDDGDIVISYDAMLDASGPPLPTYTNTVTAAYDSAPGDPVDDEGNPVEETYEPVEDDHTIVTLPELDKTAISTGNAATPGLQIGETVTYELVMTLPEFGMESVVLTDTLPTGLTLISAEVTELGSGLTIEGTTDLATINGAADFSTSGSLLTVTLDDVVNADDDLMLTRDNDAIVVQVTARVDNISSNAAGTSLTNTATLVVDPAGPFGPLDPVTDDETVSIVEPDVDITKSGEDFASPGSVVDYSLVATNSGSGVAFNVVIADPLSDPNLSYVSGSAEVFLNGALLDPQPDVTTSGGGFAALIGQLDPGDTITVDFSAQVGTSAPPAIQIENTATVSFNSGPGGRAGSDSDDHSFPNGPGLEKTAFTSQFAETDSELGSTPFELAIGETVTYRYEITLPEIALDSVVISDLLPAGLEFVSVNVVDVAGTGASGSVSTSQSASNPNNVTFDFGAMTNASDGSIGADDVLTFDVTARVLSDGSASGGDVLTNTATLNVTPTGGDPFAPVTDTAVVTVVEPELDIQKSGPQTVSPGEEAIFTITISNPDTGPGSGPAFDIAIGDVLPSEFTLDPASLTYTLDGAAVSPASVTATAGGFDATFDMLATGSTLTVTYSTTLDADADPDTVFVNTAVAGFDSVPGDPVDENGDPIGEDFEPVGADHVIGQDSFLTKTAIASEFAETLEDGDNDGIRGLAIGEEVTYELVLTLPEIGMDSVTLTDTLPDGLVFVSASVTEIGSEITVSGDTDISNNGQLTTITFEDVQNVFVDGGIDAADQITVQIVARVDNVPENVDGVELTNTAGLIVDPEGAAPPLAEVIAVETVEIIEPALTIEKSTEAVSASPGDVISYTIVISNDADASAPAFNAVVTDDLPPNLTLTGNTVLSDPALASVSAGSQAGATSLVVTIPILQPGESLTIDFEVLVGEGVEAEGGLANSATLQAGTTPVLSDFDGRQSPSSSTAILRPFVEDRQEDRPSRAIDGIDDAQFLPVLLIDPIFTGTAEPGSNVTVNLYRQDGGLDYVRNIVADAGGHWIAIFPRVHFDALYDTPNEAYAGSVLFDAPVQLLDQQPLDSFDYRPAARTFDIQSNLNDEAYTLGVTVDRPSTLPQEQGIFNTRTYFAPAHVGEVYGTADILKVDDIFENVAFKSVVELYEATSDPLGVSLNRFNYEFLSAQTAVPGQQ